MILSGDIAQTFGPAAVTLAEFFKENMSDSPYYFSTHGCRFWVSLGAADLDEDTPLVAATAAARALLSKKFAMGIPPKNCAIRLYGRPQRYSLKCSRRHGRLLGVTRLTRDGANRVLNPLLRTQPASPITVLLAMQTFDS